MSAKVLIVILNWNNAPDTIECLESVGRLDYPNCHVLVVDNGSTDGSVGRIRNEQPEVEIVETGENLGYTGGNNVGIEHALSQGCDYVWLLNDDVVVAPDSLSALIKWAMARPQAGLLGPKVYTIEDPQQILSAGGEFGNAWQSKHRGLGELDEGQFDQVTEVDWLTGCALLASRQLIEEAGALDDRFFAYHEDIEWCYRAGQAGFPVLFVPDAKVWHPDTSSRDATSTLVTYYISRNHLIFLRTHRLGLGAMIRCFATYGIWLVNWSINPKWRHYRPKRDALWLAIRDFALGRFGKSKEL